MPYCQREQGEGIKYQRADRTFRVEFSERVTLSREPVTGMGSYDNLCSHQISTKFQRWE